MIDRVTDFSYRETPVLSAELHLKQSTFNQGTTGNWPGYYIIEGLAQCCSLLGILSMHCSRERIFSFEDIRNIISSRSVSPQSGIALLASVDIVIKKSLKLNELLSYEVSLTRTFGTLYHYHTRAFVGEKEAANGHLVCGLNHNSTG